MSMNLDLQEIKKRANHAAFQDGLMEIFMGFFLLGFGGAMATDTVGVGVPFIVLAIFFANPLIEKIKVRTIYPRIGYVKLPSDPNTTGKGIAIAAGVFVVVLLAGMGISMGLLGSEAGVTFFMTYLLPPATGFMMGIGPFWLAQTYGLVRGYILAALFLLSGIAMPLFGIASGYEAVGLQCTLMGLVALIVGAFMFTRFIRKNPPSEVNNVEGMLDEG